MARSRKKNDGDTPQKDETATGRETDAGAPKVESGIEDAEVIEETAAGQESAPEDTGAAAEQGKGGPSDAEIGAAEAETSGEGVQETGAEGAPTEMPGTTGEASEPGSGRQDADDARNGPSEAEGEETPSAGGEAAAATSGAAASEASEDGPGPGEERETRTGGEDTGAAAPVVAVAQAPAPRRGAGGFLPLVIGGAVAALIGYGAARLDEFRAPAPEGPTPEENAAAIAGQSDRLAGIESTLAELRAVDLQGEIAQSVAPVSERMDSLTERLDAFAGGLAGLEERVETIALRPTATGIDADEFDDALSEFRNELNAAIANAQSEIAEARAEAARISEEAFSAEQAATARAAWEQVKTALESGAPYEESLGVVASTLDIAPPEALAGAATSGVPTLAELQQSFPDVAREALDASIRAETGDAPLDRLAAFLRVQSGVRSLAPREGDDPDAVLSRMEAALRNGDLATVLSEAEALPEPGKAALADWTGQAQKRISATEAASALSGQLNTK